MSTRRVPAKNASAVFLMMTMLTLACNSSDKHSITGPTGLAVSSVVPNTGAQDGPTDVRVNGMGFKPGATVTIGGATTNVTVVSSTVITATTPGHAAGPVDVIVTNPDGATAPLNGGFTFLAPLALAVTSITPVEGLPGDVLRVTGTKFQTGATVTLDGQPAASAIVVSSTSIAIIAPAHAAGPANVTVSNPGGETATKVAGFTYQLVTLSASANTVAAGSALNVSWVAPSGRSEFDWVALFKAGAASLTYADGWWSYTKGLATGTLSLTAPGDPGPYEFRYLVDDGFAVAAQTGVILVTPAPALPYLAPLSRTWFPTPPAAQSPDPRWPRAWPESRWR